MTVVINGTLFTGTPTECYDLVSYSKGQARPLAPCFNDSNLLPKSIASLHEMRKSYNKLTDDEIDALLRPLMEHPE